LWLNTHHHVLHRISYGAERFEDGASQINKSDMFFGDDGELNDEQLKHLDEVTMKNVKFVKMTEGDVVLLDNYKTLHGRNVFDGTRKHGVAWFEGWEGEEQMKQQARQASKSTPHFIQQ
jgi:Taurine catabolism dioxygenase TauD, TfdA family